MKNEHTSSTAKINAAIRKAGIEHITLRGGRGYQYFIYSDGAGDWDTRSEYVCYVRDHSVAEWIELAREFANEKNGTAEAERTARNLRRYFKANKR